MDIELKDTENQKTDSSEYVAALQTLTENIVREFNNLHEEIKKPRRKIWLFVSVILFIYASMFYIGTIAVAFVDSDDVALTNGNTIEITATISKIQPIPYRIQFEEYNAVFSINSEHIIVDMDELSNLMSGQTVVFRIKETEMNNLTKLSNTIEIVSLKNSNDIITLTSYNDYFVKNNSEYAELIVFSILGTLFLAFALLCMFKYKKNKKSTNN